MKTPEQGKKKFIETLGLENKGPIGEGVDKKVYDHPDDPSKVIAIRKDYPEYGEQVRARFYLRKILHFLIPESIPDVHLATPELSILERRHRESGHLARQKEKLGKEVSQAEVDEWMQYKKNITNDPKKITLVDTLRELGVEIDYSEQNFSRDENGNMQYLDTISENSIKDLTKIEKAILVRSNEEGFKPAMKHLDRLKEIFKEMGWEVAA